MKKSIERFVLLLFIFAVGNLLAQNRAYENAEKDVEDNSFVLSGSVRESDTYKPIPNVTISIVGGNATKTGLSGDFNIRAKEGDEILFAHPDMEPVYYTVTSNEDITVEVQPNTSQLKESKTATKYSKRKTVSTFRILLDSAKNYQTKSIEKSMQYVTEALSISKSSIERAEVYKVLANTYMLWKQYDLAISNYQLSLQNKADNVILIKLSEAYYKNKNYKKSIASYNSVNIKAATTYQQIQIYEGLAGNYEQLNDYNRAIKNYQKALKIAEKHLVKPKITDLNSKIGAVYSQSGAVQEAREYYNNSLELASKENRKRAVEEKIKVADFENKNQDYNNEIKLRKEAIESITELEETNQIEQESALTLQKQNYKIGNAYYLQHDYKNAIPYLEKSIEEAENDADLVVKKDAIRKLSEVHRDAGNYNKALETYKDYQETVDALYLKMEQEIAQAASFNKNIAEKQNRISSLETDKALNESKYQLTTEQSKRQKLIIYSLAGGILLLLLIGYFMYKLIQQQKVNNNLLALKTLRTQMNPHFIFNALNSVNSFIALKDERTANQYLSDFSQLMRSVLENSEQDFIPLEKEIQLLELYTELEHFRFQNKFDYQIHVNKNVAVNEFVIPPMLLQPYIENAVWHGLRYKKEKGELRINIDQTNDNEIQITIIDNGIGREKSKSLKTENQKKQNSKGMSNIKKRITILNQMYKDKVDVTIDNYQETEDTGTKVVITLKKD